MLADDLKLSSDEDDSDKVWVLFRSMYSKTVNVCALWAFFHCAKYMNFWHQKTGAVFVPLAICPLPLMNKCIVVGYIVSEVRISFLFPAEGLCT